MSDILNHYYCAREAYLALPEEHNLTSIITKYYDAYRLGSQGPDFFYYNIANNYNLTSAIGKLVHTKNIDKFFYYSIKFAQEHPEYSEICLAYLAGFLSHYALDTITHPFIYFRSGKALKEDPATEKFAPLHKLYEVLLDTAMTQYEYSRQAVFENPEKVFIVSDSTLKFLESYYKYILKKVYNLDISGKDIRRALRSAARIIKFSKDPFGRKEKLLKNIEKRFGVDHILSKIFYPMYTNEFHILNMNHREWKNPISGESHYESYPELFHQAIDLTQNFQNHLDSWFMDEALTIDEISEVLGNLSYLSGVDSEEDQNYQYFDNQFIRYLYNEY